MFGHYCMPQYRIHRMKETPRNSFRWAAHTAGAASVKPRDYEPADTVEAPSPYAAWASLREAGQPLQVGDLLEQPDGVLRIYKYVGFEEAAWVTPEVPAVAAEPNPGEASAAHP
jgi:hypothetical protein